MGRDVDRADYVARHVRSFVSFLLGAAILVYESWGAHPADAWIVVAGLLLVGSPIAEEAVRRATPGRDQGKSD